MNIVDMIRFHVNLIMTWNFMQYKIRKW